MAEEALNLWREKLEFLQRELAISADPSLKFQLQQQIKEAQAKLADLKSASVAPPLPPGSGFDVFLSHNSADKPTIRKIAESLQRRGLRIWLDEWELVPGRPWQEALEVIIRTTRSAAVFVGTKGIGPWEEPEMRACLSEFVDRNLPVIPVLLPNTPGSPKLPLFLRQFTWVDLRPGISNEGLDRLVWGIKGSKAGTTHPIVKLIPPSEQQTKELRVNRITDGDYPGESGDPKVHVANLPTVDSRLIGRDEELKQLDDDWTNPTIRLVSIVAMGGIGKTSLAINWWHSN